jgi:hypothetical protein
MGMLQSKLKRTTESSDRYDSTSIATTTEQEEEDLELVSSWVMTCLWHAELVCDMLSSFVTC